MHHAHRTASTLFLFALAASTPWGSAESLPHTSLSVVERSLLTTAQDSFNGHHKGFEATTQWSGERLRASQGGARAPHLACTEYSRGGEAISYLQEFLSPETVRPVAHSSTHGACFFVTASHDEARAMSDSEYFGLTSISPFPSALKIAPGVLDHGVSGDQAGQSPGRLATTHGRSMRMDNVEGLNLELSPGTLPAHSPQARMYIAELLGELMSESIDLHAGNVWSDPVAANGEHRTTPGGAVREREWNKAATLVHELSVSGRTTPGDICSWGSVSMHHSADDLLLVSGLDHLFYTGTGAMGSNEEATELRVACFMGLVSFLSSRVEVLRVSPRHGSRLMNAVARPMIQSATLTESPLTAAGLDGTGQVVQVVDTGLDETACFFIDDDGQEVTHGYYFEEFGIVVTPTTPSPTLATPPTAGEVSPTPSPISATSPTSEAISPTLSPSSGVLTSKGTRSLGSGTLPPSPTPPNVFDGGDFTVYPDRRKIIQYTNLVKNDDSVPGSHGTSFTTSEGGLAPWIPGSDFDNDNLKGHGSHTAGSVAGATLNTPAETVTCSGGRELSCVGGCIDRAVQGWSDDINPSSSLSNDFTDLDRICPMFGCDEMTEPWCLSDDVGQTLTDHGGMAQGAKLSIFDVFYGEDPLSDYVGNGLWAPCAEAGCMIHSVSLGGDTECALEPLNIVYDDFMYKNPENLLVFAAGNKGDTYPGRTLCTIISPAIGKNVLAVGSTSTGEARLTTTSEDRTPRDGSNGVADVDMVSTFSSWGFTKDSRIKPEVVAPGDAIYSASSDASDDHSCRLQAISGTSMACPIVAGASAMIRQYFLDESFYVADKRARGWCDDDAFPCEAFSPSSATVKALLINSANLMGDSSEPDGLRGFGRIQLDKGMPLGGEGSLALFVADQAALPELDSQEFFFDVDADAGLDFRATLSWIDPPCVSLAAVQLVHDLDLEVDSPSGVTHIMWASSGEVDDRNVNERVIIAAADVESGIWTVRVSTKGLTTAYQSYSLVVNGAILYSSSDPFYSDLYSVAPTSSPSGASAGSSTSSPSGVSAGSPTIPPSGAGDGSVPRALDSAAPTISPSISPSGTGNPAAPTDPSSAGSIASAPMSLVAFLVGAAVSTIAAACAA